MLEAIHLTKYDFLDSSIFFKIHVNNKKKYKKTENFT